jgi:hypothetical protein
MNANGIVNSVLLGLLNFLVRAKGNEIYQNDGTRHV